MKCNVLQEDIWRFWWESNPGPRNFVFFCDFEHEKNNKYKAAYGVIHWWLKRRWARIAAITAIGVRYEALRYTGGTAQQQAAAAHEKAQVQDEWRDQSAHFQREAEASAPFFPIF